MLGTLKVPDKPGMQSDDLRRIPSENQLNVNLPMLFLAMHCVKIPISEVGLRYKGVSEGHKSVLMWQVSEAEATSGASSKCRVDYTVTKGRALSERNAWWTVSKTPVRTHSMCAQIGPLTTGTPQEFTGSKEPQRRTGCLCLTCSLWTSIVN